MNEHEHIAVITCQKCQHKAEFELHDVIDSKEDAYEKNRILNGTLFEHKCHNCNTDIDLLYETVYSDVDRNTMIYLVHEGNFDATNSMLHTIAAIERKYPDAYASTPKPKKRIVTCHHQLREKVLILEEGLDDKVIEIIKIICMNDAAENIDDLDPISAEFDLNDGQQVIRLYGENRVVTAIIPSGIYEHITREFAEVLANDNSYVVDQYWAMEAMGIDPYDDYDCDGDCENCPKNCGDDCDDCDSECDGCERDCDNCDCRKCEMVFGDDDDFECDGNCEECHGCDEDDSESDGGWYEEDDEWDDADNAEEDSDDGEE